MTDGQTGERKLPPVATTLFPTGLSGVAIQGAGSSKGRTTSGDGKMA
jgi:hypothetical protein